MKTIIDKNTGEVIYGTTKDEVELNSNEIVIDELLTENFTKPYFNLVTREFYEAASLEEINNYKNEIKQIENQYKYEKLKETDWYVTRFIETGRIIPSEILILRENIRNNN
jgi:hypothetical protein